MSIKKSPPSAARGKKTKDLAPFDPSEWPIAWMARAERQHARNATLRLAPLGIHHREFRVLALLAKADALPISELAEMAVLERPTVSKMIDRLQAEGWVSRGEHASDRRRSPLSLTPVGRAKVEAAAVIVAALLSEYQSGMPSTERDRFMAVLKEFYQRVHAARFTPPA
jgi:DNA-binding MarR family transcriptional regulator